MQISDQIQNVDKLIRNWVSQAFVVKLNTKQKLSMLFLTLCYKMWAKIAERLLNPCVSFLSPIAAAKSLLNKKADVKVRLLSAPDVELFAAFFFFLLIIVHVYVAEVCLSPHLIVAFCFHNSVS